MQFKAATELAQLRDSLRPLFAAAVASAAAHFVGIEPLLDDPVKSCGDRFYGSIRRSPLPADQPTLRWEKQLESLPDLTIRQVHLLVSDDALTNQHTADNALAIQLG